MKLQKKTQHQASIEQQRSGFTLIELLVVIAVIGILMALLLPAIQSARESGRKTVSMSNLYQLGMATNRFDQDKGRAPGWKETVNGTNCSWPVVLLPYLERNDAYDAFPSGAPSIDLFRSPNSPAGDGPVLAYAGNWGNQVDNRGNTGSGDFRPNKNDGVMLNNVDFSTRYSLSDVADGDGTATTLLFAEKCGSENQGVWNLQGTNVVLPSNGVYPPFYGFGIDGSAARDLLGTAAPRSCKPASLHVGGWCVAYCDGHTAFLNSAIGNTVYAQIVTSRNSAASATARNTIQNNGWNTAAYVFSDDDLTP